MYDQNHSNVKNHSQLQTSAKFWRFGWEIYLEDHYLTKSSKYIVNIILIVQVANLHKAVQTLVGDKIMDKIFVWLKDLLEREQRPAQFPALTMEQFFWKKEIIRL